METGVALRRGDVGQAPVMVFGVVPLEEPRAPGVGVRQALEPARVVQPALQGAEECLDLGVVVRRAGPGVVAAHAEAYRAEDPETIGVDTAEEAAGTGSPSSRPGARRTLEAQPAKDWGRDENDLTGGRRDRLRC